MCAFGVAFLLSEALNFRVEQFGAENNLRTLMGQDHFALKRILQESKKNNSFLHASLGELI